MTDPKEWLEIGQRFHGHKCPAMPMGLRVGAAAMNALDVERAPDGQLLALLEIGENHCATCFADGVQVITGCTFGKGNIKKLEYGKWAVTLVDRASGRAVRANARAEAMANNKKTTFFSEYREKGIPASKVPDDVVEPLVVNVINAPQDNLVSVSEIFHYTIDDYPHSFASFVCDECGEMTAEPYGRIAHDKHVCLTCREKITNEKERRRA